jgi:hypothetical protein
MEAFKKTVRPGRVPVWTRAGERLVDVFVSIELNAVGELSISAVEGPLASGNACGGCGQCDALDVREFASGWTAEMVGRLRDIWREWHLNHMRAYDAAMKADGWPERARVPMLGYEFSLTSAASDAKRQAEKAALEALKAGATFTPSARQVADAARVYSFVTWVPADAPEPDSPNLLAYQRSRHLYGPQKGELKAPDRKTLGWLRPSEHPDGLLTKVHPASGNGYGSALYREDVPADVLEWLRALPAADKPCPWGSFS